MSRRSPEAALKLGPTLHKKILYHKCDSYAHATVTKWWRHAHLQISGSGSNLSPAGFRPRDTSHLLGIEVGYQLAESGQCFRCGANYRHRQWWFLMSVRVNTHIEHPIFALLAHLCATISTLMYFANNLHRVKWRQSNLWSHYGLLLWGRATRRILREVKWRFAALFQ